MDNQKDFEKFQIQEAINTFRIQYSLYIQISTVFVVADVTVIGYALHEKMAGIIFIGTIFPLMILFVRNHIKKTMLPIIYTAVTLEQEFKSKKSDWLISTFIKLNYDTLFLKRLIEISNFEDDEIKINSLKLLGNSYNSKKSSLVIVLYTLSIGHIIMPFIMHIFFSMNYFS